MVDGQYGKTMKKNIDLLKRARKIKLVLTDCDGVLTDGCVYYSATGESLKMFSMRDGMGVERLREVGVETGIITGEVSEIVLRRAEKLKITEVHLGAKDKVAVFNEIVQRLNLSSEQIAYIGDDHNDLGVIKLAGLSATPADAMPDVAFYADHITKLKGGKGAFREFAELIIYAVEKHNKKKLL